MSVWADQACGPDGVLHLQAPVEPEGAAGEYLRAVHAARPGGTGQGLRHQLRAAHVHRGAGRGDPGHQAGGVAQGKRTCRRMKMQDNKQNPRRLKLLQQNSNRAADSRSPVQ